MARTCELRRLLAQQVGGLGAEAWPFAEGRDFLKLIEHLDPACILLDMDLDDMSGLELMAELAGRGIGWPVIAFTSREEMRLAVETMKMGALDFLRLPVTRDVLAVAMAPAWIALDAAVEASESRRDALERLSRLTSREVDVALALLNGGSNKRVAHEFGISVRTVEMHRAHVMAKLDVRSLAEVALLATQAGLDPGRRVPLPAANSGEASDCRGQLGALAKRLAAAP